MGNIMSINANIAWVIWLASLRARFHPSTAPGAPRGQPESPYVSTATTSLPLGPIPSSKGPSKKWSSAIGAVAASVIQVGVLTRQCDTSLKSFNNLLNNLLKKNLLSIHIRSNKFYNNTWILYYYIKERHGGLTQTHTLCVNIGNIFIFLFYSKFIIYGYVCFRIHLLRNRRFICCFSSATYLSWHQTVFVTLPSCSYP